MEDEGGASIPFRVVIDEAEAQDEVDAETVVPEVEETVEFGFGNVVLGLFAVHIDDVVGQLRRGTQLYA